MNLVFNSSIPRSGSTLLQNLLAQNPNNHCTPTSDVIELLIQARNSYGTFKAFQSQGVMQIKPRIRTLLKGMLEGYYADCAGKTVFEKSRGWIAYIELLEEILERPVKVVVCVRDIREIVASFERLHRTNQLTKQDAPHPEYIDCQSIEGRARCLLSPGAVVGLAIVRLRDAINRGLGNRLVIVRNSDLVDDPVATVMKVCTAVGAEPFLCNPRKVEQLTHEDDSVHGMELHTVRETVNREGMTDWREYLPESLGEYLNEQYPLIQELAGVYENENSLNLCT